MWGGLAQRNPPLLVLRMPKVVGYALQMRFAHLQG
jgi:hypothetical protein